MASSSSQQATSSRDPALPDATVLEAEIITMAGQLNALEYHFIKRLADFDKHELWAGDGIKSFAHWLNWKCGISTVAAREKVRVCRALRMLPAIDDAFRTGRLSYSKVRALVRVATPENEALLLDKAGTMTAEHLEQAVSRYRRTAVPGEMPPEWIGYREPRFSCRQDEHGMAHIHAKVPAEDGAVIEKAVEKMVNTELRAASGSQRNSTNSTKECGVQAKNDSAESSYNAYTRWFTGKRAEALGRIAEQYLSTPSQDSTRTPNGNRYHVVLHVNVNDKHPDYRIDGGPCCYLEDGTHLPIQTAKRLACDASFTKVYEDDHGKVVDISTRSKSIPRAVELAVDIRDNHCCRFPNCHQQRWTDKHHIITRAEGGKTEVDNLITLCRYHHKLCHDGEYRIEHGKGDSNGDQSAGQFTFVNRRGAVIQRGFDPQFPDGPEPPAVPSNNPPAMTAEERKRRKFELLIDFYRPTPADIQRRRKRRR